MEEKVKNLFADESFKEAMRQARTAQQVQKLLADNGIELSVEDVEEIYTGLIAGDANGELDENALEDVAGGNIFLYLGAAYVGYKVGQAVNGIIAKANKKKR